MMRSELWLYPEKYTSKGQAFEMDHKTFATVSVTVGESEVTLFVMDGVESLRKVWSDLGAAFSSAIAQSERIEQSKQQPELVEASQIET